MDEGRVLRLLPLGLLAVATVAATAGAPELGPAAGDVRVTLALTAVTALWMLLTRGGTPLHWVIRSALAFALCWLNPLYAIFAFVGFLDLYPSLRRAPATTAGLLLVAVTQGGAQSGGFPPGTRAQAVLFAALVLVNAGLGGLFSSIGDRTERRRQELERLNEDLERALTENAALHERLVAGAREAGVQEERRRLAREIHDTIAQDLAGIITQLEASPGNERRAKALELARSALTDARRSVLDLSPGELDGVDLPAALAGVVREWDDGATAQVEMEVTGHPEPLHPEVEATVLRVAQEALANVAKHAGSPGRVGVTLSYDDAEIVLDIRDDGAGFDPGAARAPSSFGLLGMVQRAERLAGALEVESRPGCGTAVFLRLPALGRAAA